MSGFFYEVRQTAHFADRYKLLGERFISHGNIPGSFPKNPSHAAADTGFSIGGDGSCEDRFMADGKAEGAVSGVLVFMVEIALRGEGSADAVHSQMDRHRGVSRVERDRWVDVVLLKEIQGDAAGVLVRVEENEVFLF